VALADSDSAPPLTPSMFLENVTFSDPEECHHSDAHRPARGFPVDELEFSDPHRRPLFTSRTAEGQSAAGLPAGLTGSLRPPAQSSRVMGGQAPSVGEAGAAMV